jgi:hypothetical protein
MDAKQFLDFYQNKLVAEEIKIFTLKGGEYSGDVNRFQNFEKLALELDLHPLEVAWIYMSKHKDGIATFIKDCFVVRSNEDVIGRINDMRNYCALIAGMIVKYRALSKEDKWYIEPFKEKK